MLIEVIAILLIAITSITMINSTTQYHQSVIADMSVFISMMNAITYNRAQAVVIEDKVYNTYYPTHAFARSYTHHFRNFTIVFHIGRGYYAIKKRE